MAAWIEAAAATPCAPYDGTRPMGINLYGDLRSGTGLSRSVALLRAAIESAGIPYSFYQTDEREGIVEEGSAQIDYAVNLLHLQPLTWASFTAHQGVARMDGHVNIAYWLWETPALPAGWARAALFFDEVWAPSAFIARAVRRCASIPVRVMRCGVWTGEPPATQDMRTALGIPGDAFVCILLYDGRSVTERKNPLAGIRAYCRAFPQPGDGGQRLIVKAKHIDASERLRIARVTGGRDDVLLIDEEMGYDEAQSLVACADVLISLHRAEGFGLTLAEAMLSGTVVVATDYSSTTEFLDAGCGCPVPCRLVRTRKTYGPYPRGTVWAEPDIDCAAAMIRRLYEQPGERARLAAAALRRVRGRLAAAHTGARIRSWLERIAADGGTS